MANLHETSLAPQRPIEEFFGAPEFEESFRDWRQQHIPVILNADKLKRHLIRGHTSGDDVSQLQSEYDAQEIMELPPEEFEQRYGYDDYASRLRSELDEARDSEHLAIRSVINRGKEFGISQFAAYGLSLYTKNEVTSDQLLTQVRQAEEDFNIVDSAVRSNAGDLLTAVSALGIYSGIAGNRGLVLSDEFSTSIPVQQGTLAYANSLVDTMDPIEVDSIFIRTSSVHSPRGPSGVKIYDSSKAVHAIASALRRPGDTAIITGSLDEQPARSYENEQIDPDFLKHVYGRAARIGELALASKS